MVANFGLSATSAAARPAALGARRPPLVRCCKAQFIAAQKISPKLEVFPNNSSLLQLKNALSFVPPHLRTQLHLEFGVRKGESLRYLAKLTGAATRWDGFDSFQGLPATADGHKLAWGKGRYTTHGQLPEVPPHVSLHAGWFNETLPPFLDAQLAAGRGAVGFANLDADLYVSTIIVFEALFSRCMHRRGTVFSFDELFGTREILNHEWALNEATKSRGITFKFVSFARTPRSRFARAAVQIEECGAGCPRCDAV